MEITLKIQGNDKLQQIDVIFDGKVRYTEVISSDQDVSFYLKNIISTVINNVRAKIINESGNA